MTFVVAYLAIGIVLVASVTMLPGALDYLREYSRFRGAPEGVLPLALVLGILCWPALLLAALRGRS
jgi:hypothetical protein